jgi:hypothetical protein
MRRSPSARTFADHLAEYRRLWLDRWHYGGIEDTTPLNIQQGIRGLQTDAPSGKDPTSARA